MLMLLASSLDMPEDERAICTREMVRGFRDACGEAEAPITGGQTVLNPWPIIGGVATAIVAEGEFIRSDGAKAGDVIVLTKPLGTQIAVNVHQWRREDDKLWRKCLDKQLLTESSAKDMMHAAVCSMARLNRHAGRLARKHGAHACTDVTGFGILGHVQNLADNQRDSVGMELSTLPCIANTMAVNNQVFNFRLKAGFSAETSGGLMVCIPEANVEAFRTELEAIDGCPTWIIGQVVEDVNRRAKLMDNLQVLEV